MEEPKDQSPSSVQSAQSWSPDIFRAYEDGKHRRYNLLFAVNGGAFAVTKLFTELQLKAMAPPPAQAPEYFQILGNLHLWQLSLGMVWFNIIMILDIFTFGYNMRQLSKALFRWPGKLVLFVIGWLLAAGWTFVGFTKVELAYVTVAYLTSIVIVYFLLLFTKRDGHETL
jgi:hypothetical protein